MGLNLFVFFHREKIRWLVFDQYFQTIFGERWEKIKEALLQEPQQKVLPDATSLPLPSGKDTS